MNCGLLECLISSILVGLFYLEHLLFMVATFWYTEAFSRFSSGAIIQTINK